MADTSHLPATDEGPEQRLLRLTEELRNENERLEDEARTLGGKNVELVFQLEEMEGRLAAAQTTEAQLRRRVEELEAAAARARELEDALSAAGGARERLQQELAEARAGAEQQQQEGRAEVARLQSELDEARAGAERQQQEGRAEVARLQEELTEARAARERLDEAAERQGATLAEARAEAERLQQELTEARAARERLDEAAERQGAALAEARAEAERLQQEARTQAERHGADLAEAGAERERLQAELADARSQAQQHAAEAARLQGELDSRRSRSSALEGSLSRLEQHLRTDEHVAVDRPDHALSELLEDLLGASGPVLVQRVYARCGVETECREPEALERVLHSLEETAARLLTRPEQKALLAEGLARLRVGWTASAVAAATAPPEEAVAGPDRPAPTAVVESPHAPAEPESDAMQAVVTAPEGIPQPEPAAAHAEPVEAEAATPAAPPEVPGALEPEPTGAPAAPGPLADRADAPEATAAQPEPAASPAAAEPTRPAPASTPTEPEDPGPALTFTGKPLRMGEVPEEAPPVLTFTGTPLRFGEDVEETPPVLTFSGKPLRFAEPEEAPPAPGGEGTELQPGERSELQRRIEEGMKLLALQKFDQSWDIFHALAQTHPDDVEVQEGLFYNYVENFGWPEACTIGRRIAPQVLAGPRRERFVTAMHTVLIERLKSIRDNGERKRLFLDLVELHLDDREQALEFLKRARQIPGRTPADARMDLHTVRLLTNLPDRLPYILGALDGVADHPELFEDLEAATRSPRHGGFHRAAGNLLVLLRKGRTAGEAAEEGLAPAEPDPALVEEAHGDDADLVLEFVLNQLLPRGGVQVPFPSPAFQALRADAEPVPSGFTPGTLLERLNRRLFGMHDLRVHVYRGPATFWLEASPQPAPEFVLHPDLATLPTDEQQFMILRMLFHVHHRHLHVWRAAEALDDALRCRLLALTRDIVQETGIDVSDSMEREIDALRPDTPDLPRVMDELLDRLYYHCLREEFLLLKDFFSSSRPFAARLERAADRFATRLVGLSAASYGVVREHLGRDPLFARLEAEGLGVLYEPPLEPRRDLRLRLQRLWLTLFETSD